MEAVADQERPPSVRYCSCVSMMHGRRRGSEQLLSDGHTGTSTPGRFVVLAAVAPVNQKGCNEGLTKAEEDGQEAGPEDPEGTSRRKARSRKAVSRTRCLIGENLRRAEVRSPEALASFAGA